MDVVLLLFVLFCFYFTCTEQNSRKESHVLFYCIGSEFAPPSGMLENDENTAASIKELFYSSCFHEYCFICI